MLEKVDLRRSLNKAEYKKAFEPLQVRLADLQRRAREAGVPVIVLFEGWEAAGKGTCINRLVERLDPRGFKVHPTSAPNEEEQLRPFLWRFAVRMPARGKIAVFDRSWYGRVLVERVARLVPKRTWKNAYEDIVQFERQHANEGAVIVKFWLHISRKEQAKRFRRIQKDPLLTWKISKSEKAEHARYKEYEKAGGDARANVDRLCPVDHRRGHGSAIRAGQGR
jgi:polyphosphate kinase 2 (PPK2 family)